MSHKIGFWSLFILVTSSQLGSSIFMLPANLAPYGLLSLGGWVISTFWAMALALVFANLSALLPKNGGPHAYVQAAFGNSAAFFTGWAYWIISWISNTVIIISCIGYIIQIIGPQSPIFYMALSVGLVLGITAFNLRGINTADHFYFLLPTLQAIPIIVIILIPLYALYFFDVTNFQVDPALNEYKLSHLLSGATIVFMWGFVGLESATAPADTIEDPGKNIPRVVLTSTACIGILYLINNIGIMGVIPRTQLMNSSAPYADVVHILFGGHWYMVLSLIAAFICIETASSFILMSGHIVLGLAQDKLMPSFFAKKNKYDVPFWGIIISGIGMIPLLILTAWEPLVKQVLTIITYSVTAYLFIYIICCLAFFKLLIGKKESLASKVFPCIYGTISLVFCCWIIYETPFKTLLIASLFVVSGLPYYIKLRYKKAQIG